jgi:hypothetical protein
MALAHRGEPKRRAPRVPTRCQLDPWRGTAGGKGQAGPGGQGGQAFSGGPGAGVQELLHLVRDPPSRQGSEEGPLHEIQLQESVLFGRPEEGPREGGHAGPAAHSGVLAPHVHGRGSGHREPGIDQVSHDRKAVPPQGVSQFGSGRWRP